MAIFSRYLLAYGRKPREASKKEAPPISDSLPEFLVAKTDYMSPCSYTACCDPFLRRQGAAREEAKATAEHVSEDPMASQSAQAHGDQHEV